MSSATFPLINFPFEVLLHVVELLDSGDISSFCQVSRDLDTLAAPLLYRTLKWRDGAGLAHLGRIEKESLYVCTCSSVRSALIPHRQPPWLAFRRRPHLRNYVRTVILYPSKKKMHQLCTTDIHSGKQPYGRVACAGEDSQRPVDLQRAMSPAFVI
jgi:F-box-like